MKKKEREDVLKDKVYYGFIDMSGQGAFKMWWVLDVSQVVGSSFKFTVPLSE